MTDDEVLYLSVARELCNTRIAECSARIGEEQAKPMPDVALIEAIRQELFVIAREQSSLLGAGAATVEAAIRWHRVAHAQQRERYWPTR